MALSSLIERISETTPGKSICPALVQLAMESTTEQDFIRDALAAINRELKTARSGLIRGVKGQWRIQGQAGELNPLPAELLVEALDQQTCQSDENWLATPIDQVATNDELLLLDRLETIDQATADSVASAMNLGLKLFRQIHTETRHSQRLAAMLEMTSTWSQSRQTDHLLLAIAETSTSLLGAERATIFLWNRQTKELIGKPALGVESGELRIPENAGVVGQVIQTGEPHRVDQDIAAEQAQIDRAVDKELEFETRSLLCVPLIDSQGKTTGAFELINKLNGNFTDQDQHDLMDLANYAAVAIENTQFVEEIDSTRKKVAAQAADKIQLIGQSPAMQKIEETIERLAQTDLAVLILGENGTGKEVVAQKIHFQSARRNNVLVAVNCAAIAETLLESELFGHEKGAFTDAQETRQGKFELADNGTIFLDEIGDMSLGGQAKLLRVLEDKLVVRIGGSVSIPTDVRVIAATNQDIEQAVKEKEFRQDLFFRLNVVTIQLPPLRERGDDIILLAEHFLAHFSAQAGRQQPALSAAARKRLVGHHWPGNVRELRNMMERLSYLHIGDQIDVEDLAFATHSAVDQEGIPMDLPLNEATRHFQCEYIDQHIRRSSGNMTDAAQRLGMHRSNLYRKMKQLGMDADESTDSG